MSRAGKHVQYNTESNLDSLRGRRIKIYGAREGDTPSRVSLPRAPRFFNFFYRAQYLGARRLLESTHFS